MRIAQTPNILRLFGAGQVSKVRCSTRAPPHKPALDLVASGDRDTKSGGEHAKKFCSLKKTGDRSGDKLVDKISPNGSTRSKAGDRQRTRLNSRHYCATRMQSSA